MSFLTWIMVGLIAGWLAGLVMKGSGYGLVGNIVAGILGALVGGYLATLLFGAGTPVDGFSIPSLFTAFIGAVLLIFIVGAVSGRAPA